MESLPLQQLADETLQALVNANASKNYQKVFKTVSRNFIVYAREHDIDSFSIDHGIQFLEDHYSMSQKMAEKNGTGYIFAVSMRWQSISLRGLLTCILFPHGKNTIFRKHSKIVLMLIFRTGSISESLLRAFRYPGCIFRDSLLS